MNQVRTSKRLFIPIGAVICLIVFLVHFFFIEKPIQDYRMTFSLASADYEVIIPELKDYKNNAKGEGFFISPNLQSLADSLIENEIRRFELKIYTPNKISPENCSTIYFQKLSIKPLPEIVGSVNFGSSIPLQKSLGLFVLLLSLLLSIDFFILQKRSRKK